MNLAARIALTMLCAGLPFAVHAQEGTIPPHVAAKLGIPQEKVKKVRDLAFDANDKLIGLEADLRRAQNALDRELQNDTPDEAQVDKLVEAVGRSETAVRKNRLGLMVKVRKALGVELWRALEALRIEERGHRPHEPGGPGMEPHGPGVPRPPGPPPRPPSP